MDIPISNSQISQFALEENYMNYFSLQQCLSEMVEAKYLDVTQENNNTKYTVTDQGLKTLNYFEKNIPLQIRNKINSYVLDNRKNLKRDFEITANHFFDPITSEYLVKCGVYEESLILMEINLSVVSKDQAMTIIDNWKSNVSNMYSTILNQLITGSKN